MTNMNLEEYKNQLNRKLIESHFSKNNVISGSDILEFTPEKQINLMIIYLLMEEWESEIEKSKSVFFNYESEEVKSALASYMNVLSKNISINRVDFEKLLMKAIDFTIQLAENPESFLIVNKLEQNLPKLKKYIQYHKPYFEGNLDYESNSKLDIIKDNLKSIVEFSAFETEQIIENPDLGEKRIDDMKEITSIHQKLNSEQSTPTIADKLGREISFSSKTVNVEQKIESIKTAISINKRFEYANTLFSADTEQYMAAIEKLDNCQSEEEAKNLLKVLLKHNYEKEEANEIRTLIEQKFNLSAK